MKILDTDTVTLFFQRRPAVFDRVRTATEPVVITVITYGEVFRGRFDSIVKAASLVELETAMVRFATSKAALDDFVVLPVTAATWAVLEQLLARKGLKKIGRADLLVASVAIERSATLVTRNVKDFGKVPGLTVENWAD